jgi:hypothetical protein
LLIDEGVDHRHRDRTCAGDGLGSPAVGFSPESSKRGDVRAFVDAAIVTIARARGAPHVATFDAGFGKVDDLAVVPAR